MSKLDPRPDNDIPLYSWDTLNKILQAKFSKPGEKSALIDLRQYSISKEEIKREAEKQGYKVFEHDEHRLKFE